MCADSSHLLNFVLRNQRVASPHRLKLAARVETLAKLISDARVLYRLLGIFPIIAWAQSLNSDDTAPEDGRLRVIEKLQAWSMLLYYPMEHACTFKHA